MLSDSEESWMCRGTHCHRPATHICKNCDEGLPLCWEHLSNHRNVLAGHDPITKQTFFHEKGWASNVMCSNHVASVAEKKCRHCQKAACVQCTGDLEGCKESPSQQHLFVPIPAVKKATTAENGDKEMLRQKLSDRIAEYKMLKGKIGQSELSQLAKLRQMLDRTEARLNSMEEEYQRRRNADERKREELVAQIEKVKDSVEDLLCRMQQEITRFEKVLAANEGWAQSPTESSDPKLAEAFHQLKIATERGDIRSEEWFNQLGKEVDPVGLGLADDDADSVCPPNLMSDSEDENAEDAQQQFKEDDLQVLLQSVDKLDSEKQDLQNQLSQAEVKLNELIQEVQRLKEEKISLQQNQQTRTASVELGLVEQLKLDKTKVTVKLEEALKENISIRQSEMESRRNLQQLETENESLRQQLSLATSSNAAQLQGSLESEWLNSEVVSNFEKEMKQIKQENQELREQLQQAKSMNKEIQQQLKEVEDEKQAIQKNLMDQLLKNQEELFQCEKERDKHKATLEKGKVEYMQLLEQLRWCEKEIEKSEQAQLLSSFAQNQIHELEAEVRKLKEERERSDQRFADATHTNEILQRKCDGIEAMYKDQLNEYQEHFNESKQRIQQVMNRNHELEQNNADLTDMLNRQRALNTRNY